MSGNNALTFAACKGRKEVVAELLAAKGIDVNHQNHRGNTALMLACGTDRQKVLEQLL